MGAPLHDSEIAIGEGTVRSLLREQRPDLAEGRLSPLPGSGTDNVLWRLRRSGASDLVVRLPRTEAAAGGLESEVELLGRLAGRPLPVAIPEVEHLGRPTEGFRRRWTVLRWLDGVDAWADRAALEAEAADEAIALALAEVVQVLGTLDGGGVPVRHPGRRGGPLPPLLDALERWLDDPQWSAEAHLDVAAVRLLVAEARDLTEAAPARSFVHGDLLPGNLLLRDGRLHAVIDWGAAAMADPAQDLSPAWAVLGRRGRAAFREALDVDDAAWLRGRAFELEHAVSAILYYRPRRHPLADIMSRTLDRVLADTTKPAGRPGPSN